MKSRKAVHTVLMAAAGLVVVSHLASAQTVGDAVKLSDDQQRELVMRFRSEEHTLNSSHG